jgi:hypothetical protein
MNRSGTESNMRDEIRRLVERATVTFKSTGGRGVLVPGEIILTAAHCIAWSGEGGMALGDHHLELIDTAAGPLNVSPLAVEPVSDIAAMGPPDGQEFPDDSEAFERLCAAVRPLRPYVSPLAPRVPVPVHIFTHKGAWITGTAKVLRDDAHRAWIETDLIEGGTSGSAIVTDSGDVLGIVSHSGGVEGDDRCTGLAARPHLALPAWLVRQLLRADERGDTVG